MIKVQRIKISEEIFEKWNKEGYKTTYEFNNTGKNQFISKTYS